jgi:TatD family-associated radical SAM protein
MTITYEVGNGLYVNITNRCTNACEFCVRSVADGTYGELWLERAPTVKEITDDILSRELDRYSEIVFCGYGEPTLRLYDIIEVAKAVKEKSKIKIRINTNGHASMIYGKDVTPLLKGVIDCVSVSLNAAKGEDYDKICHPDFNNAFEGLLDFTAKVKQYVPEVMLSVVDGTLPKEDIEKCKEIARECGVKLKVREYIKN